MKRLIALLALAVCALPASAQSPGEMMERTLVMGDKAYLAFPPALVAGPTVQRIELSSSGKRVLIQRELNNLTPQILDKLMKNPGGQPPPGVISEWALNIWNQDSGRLEEIWRGQPSDVQILDMHWMGTGDAAVISASEALPPDKDGHRRRVNAIYRVAGTGGRPKKLIAFDEGGYVEIVPHPLRAQAILKIIMPPQVNPATAETLATRSGISFLMPNGVVTPPVQAPAGYTMTGVYWQADKAVVSLFAPPMKKGEKAVRKFAALPMGGTVMVLTEITVKDFETEFIRENAPKKTGLSLTQEPFMLKAGETGLMIRPLWLMGKEMSEKPRALISRSVEGGWLSESGDTVYYKTDGALWSVAIGSMPKEMYLEARAAAERSMLLSNAKQVGLAALMYASDMDDVLPGGGNFQQDLMPYLKNETVMKNFVYTFAGGGLAGVDKPAETELGHVLGPGGRAVVYIDGHAKWIKDP
jgi:hypothetical protein